MVNISAKVIRVNKKYNGKFILITLRVTSTAHTYMSM
jgi:hypothetical protein